MKYLYLPNCELLAWDVLLLLGRVIFWPHTQSKSGHLSQEDDLDDIIGDDDLNEENKIGLVFPNSNSRVSLTLNT